MHTRELDYQVERAIKFLVKAFEEPIKDLSKPVVLHGIRVGLSLYHKEYPEEIILAGYLHDVLEDTHTKFDEIENTFGKDIALIVQANTFDTTIQDKREQYRKLFEQCLSAGRSALIVKAADILDNSFYYPLAEDGKIKVILMEKLAYFLELSQPIIGEEKLWHDLKKQEADLLNRKDMKQ